MPMACCSETGYTHQQRRCRVRYRLGPCFVKLSIRNLGRIAAAELDIKPLTVFVGPNNTNKTWTAYALYGLAKRLAGGFFLDSPFAGAVISPTSALKIHITNLASQIQKSLLKDRQSISKREVKREEIIQVTSWPIELVLTTAELAKVLAIAEQDLCGASASLTIDGNEASRPTFHSCEFAFVGPENKFSCLYFGADRARLTPPEQTVLQADDELEARVTKIITDSLERVALGVLSAVVALPAERKALVALQGFFPSPFGRRRAPDFLESTSNEVSLPIQDFVNLLWISRLFYGRQLGPVHSTFKELAQVLESRVLQGGLMFQAEEQKPQRSPMDGRWRYRIQGKIDLDMHATSSLVRSLAGLDLYLTTYFREDSLLVIDEPEMNAHPDAQLKIIELLAILAQKGVTVIITTHSPYIADHLGNLIQASQLNEQAQEQVASEFKLGRKDAFLSPEDVAVYLFSGNGQVRIDPILDRESGIIDLDNFSESTGYMSNLINSLFRARDRTVTDAGSENDAT